MRNKIENKQPNDNEPQLHSESIGGIKADLVLKVYALLMQDVLPSRANNSANDQDSVQEFLTWSGQISVEFVTKKATFPMLAFDQVTPPFSLRCVFGEPWKSDSA